MTTLGDVGVVGTNEGNVGLAKSKKSTYKDVIAAVGARLDHKYDGGRKADQVEGSFSMPWKAQEPHR